MCNVIVNSVVWMAASVGVALLGLFLAIVGLWCYDAVRAILHKKSAWDE
jgi:hypothetical protein